MKNTRSYFFAIAAATYLMVVGTAQAGQTLNFSDSQFASGDWLATKVVDNTPNSGATFSVGQNASGGNPGAFQTIDLNWSSDGNTSEGITVALLPTLSSRITDNAIVDPQTSGAIVSVDFSVDGILLSDSGPGSFIMPILAQNGAFYQGPNLGATATTWSTHAQLGLIATDFNLIYGSGPANPDFSTSGSPIQFGYRVGSALGAGYAGNASVDTGVDNWTVTVHTVPEPAPLALLAPGGLLLASQRRRVRA